MLKWNGSGGCCLSPLKVGFFVDASIDTRRATAAVPEAAAAATATDNVLNSPAAKLGRQHAARAAHALVDTLYSAYVTCFFVSSCGNIGNRRLTACTVYSCVKE